MGTFAGISSLEGINGSADFSTCFVHAEQKTDGPVGGILTTGPDFRATSSVNTLAVVTEGTVTQIDVEGEGHYYPSAKSALMNPVPVHVAIHAIQVDKDDAGSVDITITGLDGSVLKETTSLPITRGSMKFGTE